MPLAPSETGIAILLHPISVNFAVGLLVFGLLSDFYGAYFVRPDWQYTGKVTFLAGVVSVGVAVVTGWLAGKLPANESVFEPEIRELVFYHSFFGYGLFAVSVLLAIIRLQTGERLHIVYRICAVAALVGLTYQGYLGGQMVYRYGVGVQAALLLNVVPEELESPPTTESR